MTNDLSINMTSALIIFVRNPVLGKVKTRLAQKLGADSALKIYEKLLAHTHLITKNIGVDKYVFYADFINPADLWENNIYRKELQTGADLGERMKNAFKELFDKGYKEVTIIGSDCYALTEEIIVVAFDELQHKNIVIGPALDGGYYLLGMNILIPQIFDNKQWSGSFVFQKTVTEINTLNYSIFQLPVLNDIDEAHDVNFTY